MHDLNEEDLIEIQRLMTSDDDELGDLNQFLEDGLITREKQID
ncbi:hypothetical protein [Neobacillus ginsengisoli]|uniref:Uncharacterized protein n=1 Tax=Neobacillus ginsengisoli TaxID=904295 RepID=A0ABT9Y019_9BACI|nr:hypothetical protein [Neobacillus ginsengisoli]MDQ0201172.1 hypothetical protein [Neobacillus ginsengisoli]